MTLLISESNYTSLLGSAVVTDFQSWISGSCCRVGKVSAALCSRYKEQPLSLNSPGGLQGKVLMLPRNYLMPVFAFIKVYISYKSGDEMTKILPYELIKVKEVIISSF